MNIHVLLIFYIVITSVHAQFRNYSNEFLNIGVDAAALGMSKAVVANSNNVNSIYWNPSGLVTIKNYEISLMHSSYFAGIAQYNFVGFAMPLDNKSAVGFSLIRFGVDNILNTTKLIDSKGNINYDKISLFSAADYAFYITYSKRLKLKGLKFGVNTKIIRRIIGNFASSWGFGFDAGIQFERNSWKLGVILRDITTTFNSWAINKNEFEKIKSSIPDKNQELPNATEITKPKAQMGIAKIFKMNKNFNLLTEIDLNMRFAKTNDIISTTFISFTPAIGLQLGYEKMAFLRFGAGNIQKVTEFDNSRSISIEPSFGLGFTYKGFQIDYALTNIGNVGNVLFSNTFSIKFNYHSFTQ
ncbi:PorV/PorQ family protein [Tenacibaculum sp. C7A-26P2]|uniref:putative type IX sorting system protein PorV2 n=1 Tax=Tenacibaculum sp. C7A-26P2 TaxID=3447504 RepID=UPI003F877E26